MAGRPRKAKAAAPQPQPMATLPNVVAIPTVGDQPYKPLSEADSLFFDGIKKAINASQIGVANPLWNDDVELGVMKAIGFTSIPVNNAIPINERFARRHPVSDLNIPRDPIAVMQVALRYVYENPFVAKAVRVKTDFTCKDFQHKTHNSTAKNFYDDLAIDLDLRYVIRQIVWMLYGVGVAPIWWGGEDGGQIKQIYVIDPRSCHIQDMFGKKKLWLRIDQQMIDAVRDPKGEKNPVNKALYDLMPDYWIEQIKQQIDKGHAGLIELADGSYTVIENRYAPISRMVNSLDGIPLQPAFDALQRYRLLAAGDFAVAWNVKNMITKISEGDPAAEKQNYRPPDTSRLLNLQKAFASPDYSLQVFCDPTTKIEYITPPLDVFKQEKYKQVEKEIKTCLNLPDFMWENSEVNYAGATAQLMLLREEVDGIRMLLQEKFFRPLYKRLRTGASKPGFAGKDIVLPTFDKNSLRDDSIWLQSTGEVYGQGGMSLRSYMEVYGLDYDYEMEELKKEHKELNTNLGERDNSTHAQPIFEPSQGNQNPEPPMPPGGAAKPATAKKRAAKGGRPQKNRKEDNDRTRTPRTAGK